MSDGPGEFELIRELAALLEVPNDGLGIGDDAATWPVRPGFVQVGTTDMLIEGVHFRLDWALPEDVGWKALAVNLSDLAAMGASPGRALVSVAVEPARTRLVTQLYRGLADLARATGTYVVGGDTVRSPGPLVINVALVGDAHPDRLLRRSGAGLGDLVAVTGQLGASAAGLAILADRAPTLPPDAAPLLAVHHRPQPRLAAGRALAELGVRCAIDISDGLASEARHVARASGVAMEIDVERIPLDPTAARLLGEPRARMLALAGGEDYELLFTFPERLLEPLERALADAGGMSVIGRVIDGEPGDVHLRTAGQPLSLSENGYVAF